MLSAAMLKIRWQTWLLIAVVCSLAGEGRAAEASLQYSGRIWQMDDGLPQNTIQAVTQTRDGYLWVGTAQGLARFDGTKFTIFNVKNTPELKESVITALCGAKDGSLWIGTMSHGLCQYKSGKFLHHTLNFPLAPDRVITLVEGLDGSIWAGTLGGLVRYKDGKFTQYTTKQGLASNVVRSISEVSDALWLGTGIGLNRIEGDRIMTDRVPKGGSYDYARAILQDKKGDIWIGTSSGLTCFHGNKAKVFTTGEGLANNNVLALAEDRQGNMWVGTSGGLNRMRSGQLTTELDQEGNLFDQVNCFCEDREGDIWVGARDGLHELKPKRFTSYTKQEGLRQNNAMSVIGDSSGTVYIGTWGGGVSRILDGKVSNLFIDRTNSPISDLVLGLALDPDGSLWIGSDYQGGFFHHQPDGTIVRFGRQQNGIVDPVIRVLLRDSRGWLWVGASGALYCSKDGTKFQRHTAQDGLAGSVIRALYEDGAGSIWVGTQSGFSIVQDGKFANYSPHNGLLEDTVLAFYEDKAHAMWIGTAGGGMARFRDGKYRIYTTAEGLFNDNVFGILEDDQGYLWINCSEGVFRIFKDQFDQLDRGTIRQLKCSSFGKRDGMPSVEGNAVGQPCAWKGPDGRMWFTTSRGVAVVDPKEVRINLTPPPVLVEQIIADRKAQAMEHEVRVPPGHGELEFHYTALSFVAPEKNRFRYKLEGMDSEWVEAENRRTAYYNNLNPGSYRFKVMACNNDGVWNETASPIAVTLLPHFWQTWWFIGIASVTAMGGMGGAVRHATRTKMERKLGRLKQQNAIERERTRIARDMHDEIGSKITRITFLGALAKRKLPIPGEAEKEIDKISQTARTVVSALDEIVWAVDPANDTLENLAAYISRYAAEFFENTPVQCQFEIPAKLPAHRVATDVRHNLFLAEKEALNNVLKHSGATQVGIQISVEQNLFEMLIWDNGHGLPLESPGPASPSPSAPRIGNGLKIMQQRLSSIGGDCRMESVAGKGTRISFKVSLTGMETEEGD
jgi:ligand-binding sensor domain-containing protein/signal transduction histidine kinase